uniref:AlNc14C14G1611 protein n=1 Tax=Albugo laibachii Nc14 TaxID=890382 RepID=F0W3U6_9STRA|nr:AlNc14C14G1611 [Albugo laibachii Nc14]|eukprot:CCA15694.1 AlNc14C14G1611 [Albugo laibachii Nc14]
MSDLGTVRPAYSGLHWIKEGREIAGAPDMTSPWDVTPTVSPATYFGMRHPGYKQAAENIDMAQAQQQMLPLHYVPQQAYHLTPVQQSIDMPGAQAGRVPDTRQRKLGFHPLDGKELYLGLGSGFLS